MNTDFERMDKSTFQFKETKVEVDLSEPLRMISEVITSMNTENAKTIISTLLEMKELWIPDNKAVQMSLDDQEPCITDFIPRIVYSVNQDKPIAVFRKERDIRKNKLNQNYRFILRSQDIVLKKLHDEIILKKLKKDDFNNFLENETFKDHTSLILRAINHHFSQDYVSSIFILVPELEGIIRELVKARGLDVYIPNRDGGWQYKTLPRILDQTTGVSEIFDEELMEYLRFLLIRNTGENKRHELAHALMKESQFKEVLSLRLILLILFVYNT